MGKSTAYFHWRLDGLELEQRWLDVADEFMTGDSKADDAINAMLTACIEIEKWLDQVDSAKGNKKTRC